MMRFDGFGGFGDAGAEAQDIGVAPDAVEPGSDAEKAREALREVIDPEVGLNIAALPGRAVEIQLVWQPPWRIERMSPAARRMLGFGE